MNGAIGSKYQTVFWEENYAGSICESADRAE